MGYRLHELRKLRSCSVGTEVGQRSEARSPDVAAIIAELALRPALGIRDEAIFSRYVSDMWSAVSDASRVLAPGGKAVYVVGENTVRGTYIPNAKMIVAVAKSVGLRLHSQIARELPANRRYLPPPSNFNRSVAFDNRMRREVIVTLGKLV